MPRFVVLGTGPTGLFAAVWISRNLDDDVTVVGANLLGSLCPVRVYDRMMTMLPVFPVHGQVFPDSIPPGPPLSTTYAGNAEPPPHPPGIDPRSYAVRASHDFAPASLSLALKQFGHRIWREPLIEVQRKVEQTYVTPVQPAAGRIGYVSGESPYTHALRLLLPDLAVISAEPRALLDGHLVLDDGTCLRYNYVVNTLPLTVLTKILGVSTPDGTLGAATFALARTTPTRASRLVYDLDVSSPVFRVLTPFADVALVQRSLLATGAGAELRQRIESLLDVTVLDLRTDFFRARGAYPLDPPSTAVRREVRAACDANRIVNLGRYAEWRYIDLHEVPWKERLGCP